MARAEHLIADLITHPIKHLVGHHKRSEPWTMASHFALSKTVIIGVDRALCASIASAVFRDISQPALPSQQLAEYRGQEQPLTE